MCTHVTTMQQNLYYLKQARPYSINLKAYIIFNLQGTITFEHNINADKAEFTHPC